MKHIIKQTDAHADAQVDEEQDHPGVGDDEAAADEGGRLEDAAQGARVVVGALERGELVGLLLQQRGHVGLGRLALQLYQPLAPPRLCRKGLPDAEPAHRERPVHLFVFVAGKIEIDLLKLRRKKRIKLNCKKKGGGIV